MASSIDPLARELLVALTAHLGERARRLVQGEPAVEGDADVPAPASGTAVDAPPPLTVIRRAFGLTPLEFGALACLLAAELEPSFGLAMRALQREGRPWLELGTIGELLGLDRDQLPELFELFLPTGKLVASGLALTDEPPGSETPLIHLRAKAARRLYRYALGDGELPDGMRLTAQPRHTLEESLLAQAERDELLGRVRLAILAGQPLIVDLHGEEGVGKKHLAEGIAAELGRPILFIDVRRWEKRDLARHLADATREAQLANALPYYEGWAALLSDEDSPKAAADPHPDEGQPPPIAQTDRPLPPAFQRHLEGRDGVVFLSAGERYEQLDRLPVPVTRVPIRFPGPSQRGALWLRMVAQAGARLAADVDAEEIGRKYALDPARIAAATRAAVELTTRRRRAAQPEGAPMEIGRNEILEACRHQLQHELATLALRVTKAHRWEDLVIPADVYHALNELLAYVRHAKRVYEEQGFAARHSVNPGLSALFSGPPGTGKTMCASIVARELDMELFRVDLSRIVSKYIGETEKNLARVFDEAQRSHAVILFDEADSLFARRTEVKSSIDRYANLEVSYLLQRMEQFSGVTVLTTNFEDAIDGAFKRRITFKMRFERPDAEARTALWKKMFPEQAQLDEDVQFEELGARFELSGGSIRNAVIRAAFLAAEEGVPIAHRHILDAGTREAREMGALVGDTPRAADADDAATAAEAPPEPPPPEADDEPPPQAPTKRARIVPITHPRGR